MNKIFDITNIKEIAGKFEGRIQEAQAEITRLTAEYSKLEQDLDRAIEADLMGEGDSQKIAKEMANLNGRLTNVKSQLDIQERTLAKAKELMAKAMGTAVAKFKQEQYPQEARAYVDNTEKEIYEQLAQLRNEQVKLMKLLQLSRNQFVSELQDFNVICSDAGLEQYIISVSNGRFMNNLHIAHPSFPELGSPLLEVKVLQNLDEAVYRQLLDSDTVPAYEAKKILEEVAKEYKEK